MSFTKQIAGTAALGAALLIGAGLSAPEAQAGYIITLDQEGNNVVANGSGSLDLTDLTTVSLGGSSAGAILGPSINLITVGPKSLTTIDLYKGFTVPSSFGSGVGAIPNSGSGDVVSICGGGGCASSNTLLAVPHGYVSGNTLLPATDTWDNKTLASLGVTPGTYKWTWGTAAHADSFTLDVVAPAAVPEPASLTLLAVGLAGMALRLRRA